MTAWTYDFEIPNDADDQEVAAYRQTAISTWRTATEARGAFPGEAIATLRTIEVPEPVLDRLTGQEIDGPKRVWHVEGEVK